MKLLFPSAPYSITFRMTVAVCAFLLLFQGIAATLTFSYFKRELKQTISAQQFTLLRTMASSIDQKLITSQRVLVDVARQISPDVAGDSATAQRFLDNRPGTHSVFRDGLSLFSADGKIIVESPYRDGGRGLEISTQDYFLKTVETGKPVISAPFLSALTPGTPAVMFTAPVRDKNGTLIAILGGRLNLYQEDVLGSLSHTPIAHTGYLYMITRGRAMIMHPDASRVMKAPEAPGTNQLLDAAILQGFEGSEESVDAAGLHVLATFTALKTTGWILGANFPVTEAYAPMVHMRKILAVFAVISTVLLMIVIRLIMGGFTTSLVNFANHVKNIGTKQGEERLFPATTNDEIAVLASTFNAMVQSEDHKSAQLHQASTHDAMTGLFNRACFDSELERFSHGRQFPFSIVVADIDGLKQCNDTQGHAVGDDLIRSTAKILMESFRSEDIVARIGGDEFAVLLPGVDTTQVEMAIQRVRAAEAAAAPVSGCCRLSISLGAATLAMPGSLGETFKEADRRMYAEKESRRHLRG